MFQHDLLYKRNLFVFYSIIVVNFIYFAMIFLGFFENVFTVYTIFTTVSLIIIVATFLLKANQQLIQLTLIISWNVSAFILVFESNNLLTFFWFICILLTTLIYQSPILSLILVVVFSSQILLLLKLNYAKFLSNIDNAQYLSAFFICMIILICSLQVMFIQKIWRKQERSTVDRANALSSREGYLHLFFQNADDAIAVFDLDSKIIDVNPAFEKLYGWTREECLGKSLPLVPPENFREADTRYNRLTQGESIRLLNTKDMRKDGTLIDVQITLSPIYNLHGEMIASSVISRDISFLKEHEQLVVQSEKLKVVGEIAAGLAHEIRNPMTVISGFVQMMNADENFPYRSYTTLIEKEIERINLIISEFLVLSKPQKEQHTKFSINEVLDSTLELFSLELQQKNIDITVEMNDVNTYIEGSYNQIKQVFINLFKNAIESLEGKGKIHLELCHDDGFVYVYLKDNGVGIPAHYVERIFEPFFTTKESGTGLGMVITNKIIQEHSGELKIRSKEKVGTEILVKIPCVDVEQLV